MHKVNAATSTFILKCFIVFALGYCWVVSWYGEQAKDI
ncbi:hypothetical protein P20429_0774 [Pseudoalteromonas sp. BSi20429]|nr:hypothetical protein P20429_0774 [Pseudoalteromonas sp. BSi20429]